MQAAWQENQVRSDVPPIAAVMVRTANTSDVPVIREAFGATNGKEHPAAWMVGTVDWHIIGSLLAGSLPGIFLGSHAAVRVAEKALRLLLAATLIAVAGRLAFDHVDESLSLIAAFTRRAVE